MTDGSGGITPVGGLGMLWYPVKPYGDFKLKFQFREGRTDGDYSNGGVFVRFPNPEQTPRVRRVLEDRLRRDASRPGSRSTAATRSSSTTASRGETRKTGSIYTFDNNTIDQIGTAKPRGEWEDYEIQVVGQTLHDQPQRRRDQHVREHARASTPTAAVTRARPCASSRAGYIGLQNHGSADLMQYRNVRVEDLAPGVPKAADGTGPFTVTGTGPHTVEVRTIDAAGNVEQPLVRRSRSGAWRRVVRRTPGRRAAHADQHDHAGDDRLPGHVPAGTSRRRSRGRRSPVAASRVPVACTGAMDGSAKLTVSARPSASCIFERDARQQ